MFLIAQGSTTLPACGDQTNIVCVKVFEWTGNRFLADVATWLVGPGLLVLLILLGGWVASHVVKRAIARFTSRLARPDLREIGRDPTLSIEAEKLRAKARAETLAGVLRSIALFGIWSFTILLALGQLNIDLGPLIAGAGILGIAIGFGSQAVVRDFLSGVFTMIEDIYSVGDDIDFGRGRGTVERISLRSTSIRTRQGVVWTVPNGNIEFVGNYSQLWARAQVDIEVSYDCDLREAIKVIEQAGDDMWNDPEWGGDELSEPPEVKGVQELGESGIFIRVRAKTKPSLQWRTERELRLRIKEALDAAGIDIPYPHRKVIVQHDGGRDPN
ncbi:MAG: mechanosensitive ion channel family protein [bacterium]|nr:mechanosensitive ion channel family protein [bacterium]MDE0500275.1 mechanosensitive ion channel family protein [bacterium]